MSNYCPFCSVTDNPDCQSCLTVSIVPEPELMPSTPSWIENDTLPPLITPWED